MPFSTAGAVGLAVKGPVVHGEGSSPASAYKYRNGCGMMSSAEHYVFHDDFNSVVTTNVPAGWTAAVIDTGATVVASTSASFPHSIYFDSDGTTEGSAIYLPKLVVLTSGKKFFMEARVYTEAADDTDLQIGLSDLTATTNPEDLWTTTAANVISFGVLDGDATVGMLSDAANSGTSVQLGSKDLSSSTWHKLAIGYDGVNLRGFVDGKQVLLWSGAAATIPTATLLAPFIGFRNGSTADNEGYCDYFRFAVER